MSKKYGSQHLVGNNRHVQQHIEVILDYVPNHNEVARVIVDVLTSSEPSITRLLEAITSHTNANQMVLRHLPQVLELVTSDMCSLFNALTELHPHVPGIEAHMFSTNNKVCQDELSRSCGIDTLLVQQLVLKLISFAGDHMTVGEAALHLQESVTEITIHENDIMRLTMLGCKLLATNAYEYGLLLTTAAAMREE